MKKCENMKSSIRKKDYIKLYNMTNNASPLGEYNCGELCDSICCTIENKNKEELDENRISNNSNEEQGQVLGEVIKLPEKYRIIILLYYF